MITTEEIAIVVYKKLQASPVAKKITGSIAYERSDYTKEDVIVVPHTITGEASVRFGQIKINIHVPDIALKPSTADKKPVYQTDFKRLIAIRKDVIEVLKNHYEAGKGYNWTIGTLNPPIKEPEHNEHFVSLSLELTVRHKKVKQ